MIANMNADISKSLDFAINSGFLKPKKQQINELSSKIVSTGPEEKISLSKNKIFTLIKCEDQPFEQQKIRKSDRKRIANRKYHDFVMETNEEKIEPKLGSRVKKSQSNRKKYVNKTQFPDGKLTVNASSKLNNNTSKSQVSSNTENTNNATNMTKEDVKEWIMKKFKDTLMKEKYGVKSTNTRTNNYVSMETSPRQLKTDKSLLKRAIKKKKSVKPKYKNYPSSFIKDKYVRKQVSRREINIRSPLQQGTKKIGPVIHGTERTINYANTDEVKPISPKSFYGKNVEKSKPNETATQPTKEKCLRFRADNQNLNVPHSDVNIGGKILQNMPNIKLATLEFRHSKNARNTNDHDKENFEKLSSYSEPHIKHENSNIFQTKISKNEKISTRNLLSFRKQLKEMLMPRVKRKNSPLPPTDLTVEKCVKKKKSVDTNRIITDQEIPRTDETQKAHHGKSLRLVKDENTVIPKEETYIESPTKSCEIFGKSARGISVENLTSDVHLTENLMGNMANLIDQMSNLMDQMANLLDQISNLIDKMS